MLITFAKATLLVDTVFVRNRDDLIFNRLGEMLSTTISKLLPLIPNVSVCPNFNIRHVNVTASQQQAQLLLNDHVSCRIRPNQSSEQLAETWMIAIANLGRQQHSLELVKCDRVNELLDHTLRDDSLLFSLFLIHPLLVPAKN